MNCGGTSTTRTLDGWNCGLDMAEPRFARQPLWPPLANPTRIARRRVKVCAATRLDLDAPSTMRCWDDNGGHLHPLTRLPPLILSHLPSCPLRHRRAKGPPYENTFLLDHRADSSPRYAFHRLRPELSVLEKSINCKNPRISLTSLNRRSHFSELFTQINSF